ncbi:MAG TPA: OmpA family protein [Spirochaetota bacterium]
MKKHTLSIISLAAIMLCAILPAQSKPVYWESEYKAVYDDKVALELQLNSLKSQYASEKSNFESKIRDLENQIAALNDRIAQLQSQNEKDKSDADARIKDLEKQVTILKTSGSSREKELIEENTKLNERLTAEINALKAELAKERTDNANKLAELKTEYEKKIADLQTRITEQNDQIAKLKNISDAQKAELERMSQQANELEKQLEKEIKLGQIRLKKMFDRIIINIDDRISFDSGSSKLKPEIKTALDKVAAILAEYPENRIYVEGNTDNVPIHTAQFRDNWQLSTERALSVLQYLLQNKKLNPTRFSAAGNSEFNPVLPNDTAENRSLNRRVDIVVIPKSSVK